MKPKTVTRLSRVLCLLLAAVMSFALFAGCAPMTGEAARPVIEADAAPSDAYDTDDGGTAPDDIDGEEPPPADDIDPAGSFTARDDVAAYLWTYGRLPDNFITKRQARELGWTGGSLEPYAPGKCIGGDTFGNREGRLPAGQYRECDIDTLGAQERGAKRLVYTEDARSIYYTEDHYESFTLLYGEEEEQE